MALAVVQSKFVNIGAGAGPFQITFTSGLTTGNKVYLFLMGAYFNGALNTTDWTIESTNGPGTTTATQYLLSRTVLGSDGTTPPVFATSTNANFRVIGIEISGNPKVESVVKSTSTSAPIAGPTTANNNDMGLLASGAGSGFGSYTPAAGWTNDQTDTGGSTTLDHIAVPTSGTSLTASPSWGAGGTSGHWMSVALMIDSGVSVAITGATSTGTAQAVSGVDSPGITQASAVCAAGSVSPQHAGSGSVVQAAAAAQANSLFLELDVLLLGVSSAAIGGDIPHTSSSIMGASSFAYANPVSFYATPISYLPLNRLMRNTPVPAMGGMDNTAVAVVARLYPSGPQPVSREVFLTGVSAEPRAVGVNPVNNPSGVLTQAFAVPRAGTVFGSEHPEGVATHVESVCAAGTVTVSIV